MKLEAAEKAIAQLKSQHARLSRDIVSTPDADEMASMKFAKEALETKLRKYATHCQRLESEKAHAIDALKSVHGLDIHDGDVAGAIVELCDRQSSLEEECEALMSAEKRASSYLSELDQLRDSNASLNRSISEAENRLAKLSHSEADLTRKLEEAKEKVASLRKERDHLKEIADSERGNVADLESEKSRQVKYLEKENLQLMLDLKAAKKQIKSTRAQLDAMRMKVIDDDTEDLGSIAVHPLEAIKADGSDIQSASLASSTDFASPVDKENHNANAGGWGEIESSSKKRRFARLNLSTRKKRKSGGTPGRSAGLGEVGSTNEDHTGECKQS